MTNVMESLKMYFREVQYPPLAPRRVWVYSDGVVRQAPWAGRAISSPLVLLEEILAGWQTFNESLP